MNGFLDRCKDCDWFKYGEVPKEKRFDNEDGYCLKTFPRGYLNRKAPHPCYSQKLACFQFVPREGFDQMEIEDLLKEGT